MRNMLTIVSAIVRQTLRKARWNEDALEVILGRIAAFSRANDLLTKTSWSSASIADVVDVALAPHQTEDGRYQVSGSDIRLSARASFSLALALHELATNAAKYCAMSNSAGHVEVEWAIERIEGRDAARFDWRELGGPPVEEPRRRGFGHLVIEKTLSSDFDEVQIEYAPSGVHCSVVWFLKSRNSG